MKIITLHKGEYEGCPLYIRRVDNLFEYLFIKQGELYTAHMVVSTSFKQRILGQDFTKKQIEDIVKVLTNAAETTITYLNNPKNHANEEHDAGHEHGQQ
jgi:hypothetical protein